MWDTPEPAGGFGHRDVRLPHLIVSAHFVYAGQIGGAEHMFYNLLRALPPLCGQVDVLCGNANNIAAPMRDALRSDPAVRLIECGGNGPRFIAEQRACFTPALSGDATLFPNYFVPPVTPRRLGRIATVLHDLQYRHFPQNFSRRKQLFLRAAHEFAVRRADRLIVISDFVAQDVLQRYGSSVEPRLAVIQNPISWDRFDASAAMERPLAAPYVLSVAAQYPHKNLETLIRGFAELSQRDRDLQLVLCGQSMHGLRGVSGNMTGLGPMTEALGIVGRVHLTGYVDDATLGNWYRHAMMFAFPSIFEGFGMPPVEALGFGLPTLTTNRTALPEATLGLACEVKDALSPSAWAECMSTVARDPEKFRPTTADVARLRAHYAPERVARLYIDACCR